MLLVKNTLCSELQYQKGFNLISFSCKIWSLQFPDRGPAAREQRPAGGVGVHVRLRGGQEDRDARHFWAAAGRVGRGGLAGVTTMPTWAPRT